MFERFNSFAQGDRPYRVSIPEFEDGEGIYQTHVKRILDLALAAIVALPIGAVIALVALIIWLREGETPFYKQDRVGAGGRVFSMWKLRTMVKNADAALALHLAQDPDAREEWARYQKLRHDPRITPLGRFLRRSSIDELPQIINVIRGEMSMVGPRPMMCDQQILYPGAEYYRMRPGITGLWQISARNESSFHERASFDQAYYHAQSFLTDLRIIQRTVGVVLNGTGH